MNNDRLIKHVFFLETLGQEQHDLQLLIVQSALENRTDTAGSHFRYESCLEIQKTRMIPTEQESNPVEVKFRGQKKQRGLIKDKTSAASG